MPPLRETRKNLMKYFLDRRPDLRGKRYTPYYDIIFILDSSASISPAHFNPSLITARNLVTRFAPDTQFAVVTFGTNATVNFKFNSSKVRNLFPAFSLPSDKNSNSCTCAEGFQMLFNRCILLASAHLAPAYPPLKTSL